MTVQDRAARALAYARQIQSLQRKRVPTEHTVDWLAYYKVTKPGERPMEYDERIAEATLIRIQGGSLNHRLPQSGIDNPMMFRKPRTIGGTHWWAVWVGYMPTDDKIMARISQSRTDWGALTVAVAEAGTEYPNKTNMAHYMPYFEGVWCHIWNLEKIEEIYRRFVRRS